VTPPRASNLPASKPMTQRHPLVPPILAEIDAAERQQKAEAARLIARLKARRSPRTWLRRLLWDRVAPRRTTGRSD
jgi:hypothetical protein